MIYLDHHAASPMDGEVLATVDVARTRAWANPSSVHAAGREGRAVLEQARERIAASILAAPADLVLTAGGTEACNLGVLGLAPRGARIVTTQIEHPAVAQAVASLERAGASVTRLAVPAGVAPDPGAIGDADLVAIQWVNHETGTVLPIEAYAARCAEIGARLFVDATQALGKIPVDVASLGASAIAFAASKIGGPPGAGALWIARDAPLEPRALGGAQERGRRAGSPDPAALGGFGAACERLPARLAAMHDVAKRRDRLERALVSLGAVVNAGEAPRVATVVNASVRGWRGQSLVAALDLEGLCASSGAACSSGLDEPSPVLTAMYPSEPWRAEAALRLSLAPSTSDEEVGAAITILERVLPRRSIV